MYNIYSRLVVTDRAKKGKEEPKSKGIEVACVFPQKSGQTAVWGGILLCATRTNRIKLPRELT